ncbi:MAG: hypothetical protein K6A69_04835 [Lachnospiraceae bacterium]|nr:hypothetical protein [Lachnospiraceae bacterium]
MDAILSNATSTLLGTTESARISFRDDRNDRTKGMKPEKSSPVGGAGVMGGAISSVAKAFGSTIGVSGDGVYNKEMIVQFNPSTIRLHSHVGDDDAQKYNFTNTDTGIGHGALALHVDMTVKLIFDQIVNNMAFTQDALNASTNTNAAIAAVADVGINAAKDALLGGARQSVQVVVEAFIAALRNNKTRRLRFQWGEMCYEGVLNRLNTTYTMFDILGRPTRAEVEMTIYLADPSIDEGADKNDSDKDNYWRKAYFRAFADDGSLLDLI